MTFNYSVLILLVATLSANVLADEKEAGFFDFDALTESANSADWDATLPWKLPKGYSQEVVSDESSLNIYGNGCPDWHDMNTVNESGVSAGRYLYRTHEVWLGSDPVKYPCAPSYDRVGAAVSVVDLKTGETKILANKLDWTAIDGIRWTPWATLVFAEETTGGRFFELMLNDDLMSGAVIARPAVGFMTHEGIEVADDGTVYTVDEYWGQSVGCDDVKPCGGGIYKFVADEFGDLSAGDLYMLKVMGDDGVGRGEWVGPIDAMNVRLSGAKLGGTSYQRPEDIELIGDVLYIAVTEGSQNKSGKQKYDGRVIAVDLRSMNVTNFVKPGMNVPVEIAKPGEKGFQTGFDNPDNLAESPDGRLIIIEDNSPSDIWVAEKDNNGDGAADDVRLFASLSDPKAEGTGIYFGIDPERMFVSIQHSAKADGDGTWAITKD